jgi:hypothetical protein
VANSQVERRGPLRSPSLPIPSHPPVVIVGTGVEGPLAVLTRVGF